LVEVSVHANIHRVCKVRVGAILLVQDDLVHLVVGLEHDFGTEVSDQAFQFHANGGRATAATLVFGAQDNHRVLAVHDDVANADFLCGFHSDVKFSKRYVAHAALAALGFAKPLILAFLGHKTDQLAREVGLGLQMAQHLLTPLPPSVNGGAG
jgi:hypothetical protein